MGQAFEYAVSLQVRHPALRPADIGERLGMDAKHGWAAGEPRATPSGTPLGGLREDSFCYFELAQDRDGQLSRCLNEETAKLHPHRDFLAELRASGGSLTFYVFWYPNGDTGDVFTPDLLAAMSALGIGLGINVYDDRDVG